MSSVASQPAAVCRPACGRRGGGADVVRVVAASGGGRGESDAARGRGAGVHGSFPLRSGTDRRPERTRCCPRQRVCKDVSAAGAPARSPGSPGWAYGCGSAPDSDRLPPSCGRGCVVCRLRLHPPPRRVTGTSWTEDWPTGNDSATVAGCSSTDTYRVRPEQVEPVDVSPPLPASALRSSPSPCPPDPAHGRPGRRAATSPGATAATPFKVKVATFNILGSQHTARPGGFAPGYVRAGYTADLIHMKNLDVIGMQEVQQDQLRVLGRELDDYWIWPYKRLGIAQGIRLQIAYKRSATSSSRGARSTPASTATPGRSPTCGCATRPAARSSGSSPSTTPVGWPSATAAHIALVDLVNGLRSTGLPVVRRRRLQHLVRLRLPDGPQRRHAERRRRPPLPLPAARRTRSSTCSSPTPGSSSAGTASSAAARSGAPATTSASPPRCGSRPKPADPGRQRPGVDSWLRRR